MKTLMLMAVLALAAGAFALTPLPPSLAALPMAEGEAPVARELCPGLTYHGLRLANYTGDGPLAVHFLVIDWKAAKGSLTLGVVPGKGGNRSRPSDLVNATPQAVAAVNGVFHQMTDPYLAFYARKIDGAVSPSKHAGGDGCLAFNRGEMPYVGSFKKEMLEKYANLLSADGMPDIDPREAKMTRAERQRRRAPRTFAGNVTTNGLTVIGVADGRQAASTGLTYGEVNRLLGAWGCDRMTNLDGGGSSVMILTGTDLAGRVRNGRAKIMNVPSDGLPLRSVERRVSESLMILRTK